MSAPLLSVRGLKTWLRTPAGIVRAVDGVDFDLHAGRTLGIVGESGSGKSVLARSLMGLNPLSIEVRAGGHALYDGRDLRSLDEANMRRLRGRDFAMVFQDPMTSLNPVMTIGEQIAQPLRLHMGMPRKMAHERAVDLLDSVGLPAPNERARQYPHELSGGQRQRVMIALALSCDPRVLIADEPTTALDVTVQRQILELLQHAQQERRMALVLITHDLGVVADMADEIAVMYAGRFVERGPAAALLAQPRMRYTEALLRCAPTLETPTRTILPSIPGRPPALTAPPQGCHFAARCRYADEVCSRPPALAGDPHAFACWHPATGGPAHG
ncbi:ABC transporter ATP-binding protein [Luteimonas aestuarii]|uniref:ABC transporter ATP-binding protein n=1 Tax=Luteimonas aestuarii TaxID=453837 RepID=A0A4R5TYP1_9GAMM|nr:ABC transporter ATP-binding protein [Luteimonas aestuarii]TDK26333.1 ABC transporter ATP-binding protein [Luteimonas aestuarii]